MQSVPLVFILGLVILAVIDKARVRGGPLLHDGTRLHFAREER